MSRAKVITINRLRKISSVAGGKAAALAEGVGFAVSGGALSSYTRR